MSRALVPARATPTDFADLRGDIADALNLISPTQSSAGPVLVVNSDKDLEKHQESLDFDKRRIWRILVGGNKLARGFTVEGLTVTYYRRATKQVDTLMQMGRWFGFRPDYRDLVRLYTTGDLHAMFAAASQDEEYLRRELRRYSTFDAEPHLTPREVPPLIAQHRPDLRPTGRNKMWNARIVEKSAPGESIEPVAYATSPASRLRNTKNWQPLLARLTNQASFPVAGARTSYTAQYAVVSNSELLDVLRELRWMAANTFRPELRWLEDLSVEQLAKWVVYSPRQSRSGTLRTVLGEGPFSIYTRQRTSNGTGPLKVASEERHRDAARRIAGVGPVSITGDPQSGPSAPSDEARWKAVQDLSSPNTGAVILYGTTTDKVIPGYELGPIDPQKVTFAFHMITPLSAAPKDGRLIKWETIDGTRQDQVVIDEE